jgi:hypothetical protein
VAAVTGVSLETADTVPFTMTLYRVRRRDD